MRWGGGPGRRVGFGACSAARVLPAAPFPHESREGGGGGGATAAAELRPIPTPRPPPPPPDIAAGVEGTHRPVLREGRIPRDVHRASLPGGRGLDRGANRRNRSTTNTPMRRRTTTLEFVNGGNDVVRVSGSNAIFEFLEFHSPIVAVGCSHRTDPVARARAREVAEAIVSAVRYDCATWSTSMRDVEDGSSNLEASRAPYAAVGGPFAIGTHRSNIADVRLIPLLHDARGCAIDSSSYPTLTSIELACKDHL